MADLTDEAILTALLLHGRQLTYVVRNTLDMAGYKCSTAQVRRRLQRLERDGKVRHTNTSYQVMLSWEIV